MKAKQYLMQIKKLNVLINNKQKELRSLYDLATSIAVQTDNEKVMSSGSSDKIGDMIPKIVDIQNEINTDVDRFIDLKREIMSVIDELEPTFCDIAYKRYIQNETWEQIAVELNYSYQWVCHLHGKLLIEVEKILNS